MSSGDSGAAIPCITGLTRIPALKWESCRVIYSAGIPAIFGFTGVGLLPSMPWQAEHTCLTIASALARSGLAGGVWARTAAGHAVTTTAASSNERFIRELLQTAAQDFGTSPGGFRAAPTQSMQNLRIVTESPDPAKPPLPPAACRRGAS